MSDATVCKCFCHTEGFAGDISHHVCGREIPFELTQRATIGELLRENKTLTAEIETLKSQLSAPLDRGLTRAKLTEIFRETFERDFAEMPPGTDEPSWANGYARCQISLSDAILSTPPVVREEKE
jgi:hypothetical protein